jgi:CRISPR/Cas system-associated protein Cas7 (RAMP superfamily)
MEQTECSETSAIKTQTPGNYPKETIQDVMMLKTEYFNKNIRENLIETVSRNGFPLG